MTTDERIEAYCKAHSLTFRPWEQLPWDAALDGPSPYRPGKAGFDTWAPAQRLRRKIIRALREEDDDRPQPHEAFA